MTIVVTGRRVQRAGQRASVMKAWLLERGVQPDHILADEGSFNTQQNLLRARDLCRRASGRC